MEMRLPAGRLGNGLETYRMTDGGCAYALQRVVISISPDFSPDLVILSAGFDAGTDITIGRCVPPVGRAPMIYMLMVVPLHNSAGGQAAVAAALVLPPAAECVPLFLGAVDRANAPWLQRVAEIRPPYLQEY